MSAEDGKVEIGGKLIDRTLLYRYIKVQFADTGATGIYDNAEQDSIESKWETIENYREFLHDEIFRQAGFSAYDAENPSLARFDEGAGEHFQNALQDFVDDMRNFHELNETERDQF